MTDANQPHVEAEASTSRQVARARNGDLVVFAANGVIMASLLARVPDVKQVLDLTPGELGLLLLGLSVGAVVGLPLAGRIAHRLGATQTVRLGLAIAIPGIILAALAVQFHAPRIVVTIGLAAFGFGSGIWDVSQNLEGSIIEQALGRAIMPWFHAAFSGGTVFGALLGAVIVYMQVPIGVHIPVIAVLTALAVFWGTGRFLPAFDPTDVPAQRVGDGPKQRSPWTERRTLLIGVMVLAAAFTEGTANDWLAVAFVDGHDLEKALGVLALAVFLSFMTAGRLLGTGWLNRYGRVPVLRVLFAAAIGGSLLVVFGNALLAFVGVAIWGVGASLGFPVGMSAAADDPSRAAVRLSVVSTIGYMAFLAGPPLLGFLGDHVGVLSALLVVTVMSLIAIAVVPNARPLVVPPGASRG